MPPIALAAGAGAAIAFAEKHGVALPLGLPTRTVCAVAVALLNPASAILQLAGLTCAALAANEFVASGKVTGISDPSYTPDVPQW
jgi:hypothetical protein